MSATATRLSSFCRASRGPGLRVLMALVMIGALVQACSDNKGPAGPTFPSGQTGTASNPAEMIVRVAINAGSIELGRRAGITVLVTNFNGRPLAGRHVQLSTNIGTLDVVDGFTDADGKFVSWLKVTAIDVANAAGVTAATVTAFVDGAQGSATVNFAGTVALTISPATVAYNLTAEAGACVVDTSAQFTVSGGVPSYEFSRSGQLPGASISSSGLYRIHVNVPAGTSFTDVVTATDRQGAQVSASVSLSCS